MRSQPQAVALYAPSPTETTIYTVTSYKLWNNEVWEDEATIKVEMSSIPKAQIIAKPPYIISEDLKTTLIDASIGGDTRIWILDDGTNMYDRTIIYNMPFRAISKMSTGLVSKKMVDDILFIVNGHFFRGFGRLIADFFRTLKATKKFKKSI